MSKETLKQIGLTGSEIKIYLDLIKNSESLASQIASRNTISRTYIYDAIQNLIKKGLITYVIKNNRKYFRAFDVKKLRDYLDAKQNQLERQTEEVNKLISELKVFEKKSDTKPVVEVFEGKEGLKTILNDIVKQKKDVTTWGATDRIKNYLPDWFLERYVAEKAKSGIKTKQIYVTGEKTLNGPGYTLKAAPKECSSPVTFGAYANKTIIFFWSEIPITVRIKNKEIAHSFRKHFEFLWEKINKDKIRIRTK